MTTACEDLAVALAEFLIGEPVKDRIDRRVAVRHDGAHQDVDPAGHTRWIVGNYQEDRW